MLNQLLMKFNQNANILIIISLGNIQLYMEMILQKIYQELEEI